MDISFSLSVSVCAQKISPFLSARVFFPLPLICSTHTLLYSLSLSSLNKKDDLHVLHGVAEQQRSIEDGVICDSHEIVSEIFERLDHGYVFVYVRVVKLNSLLPASAAAPKIKLNCATMILLLLLICFVETQ